MFINKSQPKYDIDHTMIAHCLLNITISFIYFVSYTTCSVCSISEVR